MADNGYPQHDSGAAELYYRRQQEVVESFLKDPRAAPVEADPSFVSLLASHFQAGTSIGALTANSAWRKSSSSAAKEMSPEDVVDRLDREGIEPQYFHAFGGVRDTEMYDNILEDVKGARERHKVMESFGWKSNLAAGLIAGVADPVNLIPVGGAISKVRMGAQSASRTAGRTALIAGGTTAATEVGIQLADPTKTAAESLVDIGVGTAFGALLGYGIHSVVGAPKARQIEARMETYVRQTEAEKVAELEKNIPASLSHTPPKVDARALADEIVARAERQADEAAGLTPETAPRESGSDPTSAPRVRDTDPSAAPKSLSADAIPTYNDSDRVDDRLFGVYSPSGVQKAIGKGVKFLRNPRLEMQDATLSAVRNVLSRLDMAPQITRSDVANEVSGQVNVHGVYRELTAEWANAQEAAEHLWWKNKASFVREDGKRYSQDDFAKRVYSAVIQGGRDPGEVPSPIIEKAAAGYRKYFDAVQKKYREAKILQDDVEVANAESYAPIVHMIENVRNDRERFLRVHSEAFNNSIMTDWTKARETEKFNDEKVKIIAAESKKKLDEKEKAITKEYGASEHSRSGKIFDEKQKLIAERVKGQKDLRDGYEQKLSEADGAFRDHLINEKELAVKKALLKKELDDNISDLHETYATKISDNAKKLIKERDEKIATAEKAHNELVQKARDVMPEWDKALLRRLTKSRDKAEEEAAKWADELSEAYYTGATKNAVIMGHDLPNQPGLANVLKARKSKLWQQTAADNGWIETNIFRLSESYNRRAGMDAAFATAFKKFNKKTGEWIGDIHLEHTKEEMKKGYQALIDAAARDNKPDVEAKLVAERNRQFRNLEVLHNLTRGVMSDHNAIGGNMKMVADGAMMFNAWRLMAGTVISSLGDPVNLAIANGFGKSMKWGIVPAFSNFRAAMSKVSPEDMPDMYRINKLYGIVIEHQHNSRLGALADLSAEAPSNRTQAWMQRINKGFWDVTGITYWTQLWKQAAAGVTHGRIIMAADGGFEKQSVGNRAWLTNLKLTETNMREIKAEWLAQPEKYSAGVPYAALDVWKNRNLANLVANAIHRESHNVVVTPTAGDKLSLQATPVGQLVWQFRSYGATASARLIGRNAALANLDGGERKATFYTGLFSLALAGVLVDGLKVTLGDSTMTGQSKDANKNATAKWIERWNKTPGEALYNGLDRTGTFWLLTEPSNVSQKMGLPNIQGLMSLAAGDEKEKKTGSSRFGNRSPIDAALGPSVGLINDVKNMSASITGAAGYATGINPDYQFDRGDAQSFQRMLPLRTALGFQQIINSGHRELGTIFDWPEPK